MARAGGQSRAETRGSEGVDVVARGAHILRIALDFDTLDAQGNETEHAFDTMRSRTTCYNPDMLETFAEMQSNHGSQKGGSCEIPISAVQEGMVLAQDVRLANGTLLATRGYEVTAGFVERARHFRPTTTRRLDALRRLGGMAPSQVRGFGFFGEHHPALLSPFARKHRG